MMNRRCAGGLVLTAAMACAHAALAAPQLQINEVRIDQTGNDLDEYVELRGPPGMVLNGLSYVVLGDGAGGSGVIEVVVQLNGQVIGPSGLFVFAEPTFTLGPANLIVPGANGLNFENGDNVTHLLVAGFFGAPNQDLDLNDDGTLDVTPWAQIVDRVSIILQDNPPTTTEWHYGLPTAGPEVTDSGSFVPGHVYRRPCDGTWMVGGFDPLFGVDSPGETNFTGLGDTNSDQVVDGADITGVLGNWGFPGTGDLNNDGTTDGADITVVLGQWGPVPCEPVGTLYGLRLEDVPAVAQTVNGPVFTVARVEYEFLLGQFDVASNSSPIFTQNFKLLTAPLDEPGGPLDELDMVRAPGPIPGGTFVHSGPLFVPFSTNVHYALIDTIVTPSESEDDGFTATELWGGTLEGFATMAGGSIVIDGQFHFEPQIPIAGTVTSIDVALFNVPAQEKAFDPKCPEAQRCNKQTICVQPVFIGTGPTDPDKTGRSLAVQKAEADAIWAKACVEIEWKDPIYVDNDDYKDIGDFDTAAGRAERDDLRKEKSVADCIEIFFVSTFTKANGDGHAAGDGVTVGGKTADAKVIVADAAVNACDPDSSRVLAHELGHAMGNCPHTAGTCMKPTGDSPNCPGLNPDTVSSAEIEAVRGSALGSSKIPKEPCCTDPT